MRYQLNFVKRFGLRPTKALARQIILSVHRITDQIDHQLNKTCRTEIKSQSDLVNASTSYNMLTAESEDYYADQYLVNMSKFLPSSSEGSMTIVDLGCGQGRLSLPLAKRFRAGTVTGFDLSQNAISDARNAADKMNLTNAVFNCLQISDALTTLAPSSVDILIMTEVSFYFPEWVELLPTITSAIRPGGLFVASFRSAYFNALMLASDSRFTDMTNVLQERSGQLTATSAVRFSWNHSSEIATILEGHKLEILHVAGIGVCSGITGDPHEVIARPGRLSPSDKALLMKAELQLSTVVPDAGRYIMAIARRPREATID
jgi:2-polyprenyl-3-methyl-5-hydroxy-6-metoxy-1,4-benzoquinol methylase